MKLSPNMSPNHISWHFSVYLTLNLHFADREEAHSGAEPDYQEPALLR